MGQYYVRHLPIVNNDQLLGLVSEDDILSQNQEEPIGSYSLSGRRPFVYNNEHIYEIMRKMANESLSSIPVVDREERFLGMITLEHLLSYYAESFSFSESGSIFVLKTPRQDYSLSEIAQIVESENVAILSSFIHGIDQANYAEITIKTNAQDAQRIQAALERYDYIVEASYQEEVLVEQLQERFDMLMTYLDV